MHIFTFTSFFASLTTNFTYDFQVTAIYSNDAEVGSTFIGVEDITFRCALFILIVCCNVYFQFDVRTIPLPDQLCGNHSLTMLNQQAAYYLFGVT